MRRHQTTLGCQSGAMPRNHTSNLQPTFFKLRHRKHFSNCTLPSGESHTLPCSDSHPRFHAAWWCDVVGCGGVCLRSRVSSGFMVERVFGSTLSLSTGYPVAIDGVSSGCRRREKNVLPRERRALAKRSVAERVEMVRARVGWGGADRTGIYCKIG